MESNSIGFPEEDREEGGLLSEIENADGKPIRFAPFLLPKQRQFIECKKKYHLMGGAAGGGKSHANRVKAAWLCLVADKKIKGLCLRKTMPEIRENMIEPLKDFLSNIDNRLYWMEESRSIMHFPNGSTLRFSFCEKKGDIEKYRGLEYDFVCVEELTQWTEKEWRLLMRCLRSSKGVTPFFFGSTNPGGVGHAWVKRLFITRDFRRSENPDEYEIIRATVYDNKFIKEDYIQTLKDLDETNRRALLEGDWDVFEGQYFPEWREAVHVIEPTVPRVGIKRRIIAIDYGFKNPACALWMTVDTQGRGQVYREIYAKGLLYGQLAQRIAALTKEDEKIDMIVVDPSALEKPNEASGSTMREEFTKVARETKCEWLKKLYTANNDRVQGWNTVRKFIHVSVDPNTKREGAMLTVTRNCMNLIRTLPEQIHSESNVEDINTDGEDHPVDALRYGLMELGVSIGSMSDVRSLNEMLQKKSPHGTETPKEREFRERGISDSKSILDMEF